MSTTAAFNSMAVAYGVAGAAMYPDTVTFKRTTSGSTTVDSVGGTVPAAPSATTPSNVPCRYRPASVNERALASRTISGNLYMIVVPAQYSSALIDLDAKCDAVIAARSGGEVARTFHVQGVGRYEGLEIRIPASIEE